MSERGESGNRSTTRREDGHTVPSAVRTGCATSPPPADHTPNVGTGEPGVSLETHLSPAVVAGNASADVALIGSEEWRAVIGVPEYEVSSLGRIRRTRTQRVLKGRPNRYINGKPAYTLVDLCVGGVHDDRTLHSLVAAAFIGPRPDGMQIDHVNGIKQDNRPENLEYVTPSENTRRSYALGRVPSGVCKRAVSR
jgi:hypothetical protein